MWAEEIAQEKARSAATHRKGDAPLGESGASRPQRAKAGAMLPGAGCPRPESI